MALPEWPASPPPDGTRLLGHAGPEHDTGSFSLGETGPGRPDGAPTSRRARRDGVPAAPHGRIRTALSSRKGWAACGVTAALVAAAVVPVSGYLFPDEQPLAAAELKLEPAPPDADTFTPNALTVPRTFPSAAPTTRPTRTRQATRPSPTRTRASRTTGTRTSAPAAPVSGAIGSLAKHSGLSWGSGVYIPGSSKDKVEAFAAFRGRKADVVVDWPARQSWNDLINPSWLFDAWAGTPYTKVWGFPPFPEGVGGSNQACASGAYNDQWRQIAQNIKAKGMDREVIIRLGWEFNGDWYQWAAHDPKAFAECWRQVVSTAEAVAPNLRWDWSVNRGAGQSVKDARQAYPGDQYVDIIGIDSYDGWPGATSEGGWKEHYAGEYGLKFWADFAAQHGKKVSIPEWGVYPGTAWAGNNGGDNPFYIAKMVSFFKSLGDQLAYEAYFNENASYYAGALHGPTQNPAAASRYASLYRAG